MRRLFGQPSRRVVDWLRKNFPGMWRYYPLMREWHSDDGKIAYMEAKFTPRWEGDDDGFRRYVVVGEEKFLWRSN